MEEDTIVLSASEILEDNFIPLPETSLNDLKQRVIAAIDDYAIRLHEKATAKYSSQEMATWSRKRLDAEEFLDKGIIKEDLELEAIDREEAVKDFAELVLNKAKYFHSLSRKIVSNRAKHSKAILLMNSKEEVMDYKWWEE